MVVVKIELWPQGNEANAKTIGMATIANDGTGNAAYGNYSVQVNHGGKYFGKPGVYRRGRVTGFNRRLSPYHLVLKAFQAALGVN